MELGSLDGMLMEALVFVVLLGIVRVICGMDVAALVFVGLMEDGVALSQTWYSINPVGSDSRTLCIRSIRSVSCMKSITSWSSVGVALGDGGD